MRKDGVVGGVRGIDGGAGFAIGDLEVCAGSVWARDEADSERLDWPVEAVLQGELQGVGTAGEVGVAVTPGVEIARPAESLALRATAVLADVVDEDDGEVVVSLQQAQVAEQAGHVGGAVLVPPVQPDEGIEEQEARGDLGEGRRACADPPRDRGGGRAR